LLAEGRSAIAPVPAERRQGGAGGYAALIDPIAAFDSGYFLIPREDARAMDPQALLVLEESLSLFSHAGYTPKELRGAAMGVYSAVDRCTSLPRSISGCAQCDPRDWT